MSLSRYLSKIWAKCQRQKRIDEQGLLHSEWNRKLGVCSLAGIALSMILSMTYYTILPKLFANFLSAKNPHTQAPPFFAFIFAFVIILLSAYQMAWVSRRMPRSCILYNFAYSTQCQIVAFFIAWSQLLDSIILTVVMVYAYSDHFNLLFADNTKIDKGYNANVGFRAARFLRPTSDSSTTKILLARLESSLSLSNTTLSSSDVASSASTFVIKPSSVLRLTSSYLPSYHYHSTDWFCVLLILISGAILMFSLRVLLTITIVFLIAALFTSTSTTIVALLHNLAHLHINYAGVDFFSGFDQMISNSQCFLLGFLAIEVIGYLAEECEEPSKIVPIAFKYCAKALFCITLLAFLSFFPFVYRMKAFHQNQPIPIVFNSIGIYSARYLMNVGAICGLSAALLCSFLPTTRILTVLGVDSLLPFSTKLKKLYGKAGSPRFSVFVAIFLVGGVLTVVPRDKLLELLPLNLCLRLFVMAILVHKQIFANDEKMDNNFEFQKYDLMRDERYKPMISNDIFDNNEKIKNDFDSDDYSDLSSNEEDYGQNSHLLERIWRLANCDTVSNDGEQRGLLEHFTNTSFTVDKPCCQHGYGVISEKRGEWPPHSAAPIPRLHNCLRSPCASNFALSSEFGNSHINNNNTKINNNNTIGHHINFNDNNNNNRYHIYESTSIVVNLSKVKTFPKHQVPRGGGLVDPEKSAQRMLSAFIIVAALVAVSHKILWQTADHMPILALISCLIGSLFSLAISYHTFYLKLDSDEELNFATKTPTVSGGAYSNYGSCSSANGSGKSNRWIGMSCLASIFIMAHIFVQFFVIQYLKLALYFCIGSLVYASRICRRKKT